MAKASHREAPAAHMIEDADPIVAARPMPVTLTTLSVAETAAILREHALLIAVFAVACAVAAYGLSLLMPQSFVANTQIFIDPRTIQALDSPPGQSQADGNAEIIFVESQAQIVTSQSVLARVVAGQKLYDDPEFNAGLGSADDGPLARFTLRLHADADTSVDAASRAAQSALHDRVTVRRPERTFVLDVAVRARTAEKAARLANALAQAYFDEQSAAHTGMAQRANASLTDRLDELRERVRQSEDRAQAFRRSHGLVGTRTQLVSEQQLTDATTQLALARSKVIQARARLDDLRHPGSEGPSGGSPEDVGSPTVTLLRGQQADARRRLDLASTQFGPLHPSVRDAQSELDGLNRAISSELARIAQSAKVELQRATSTETAQRAIVAQLSDQASNVSEAFVQLGELEREVDINKNLLTTFLSRARETGELAQVKTSNARVISTALPPRSRSFPPRGSVFVLLGLLGGLVLGSALALWTALLQQAAAADDIDEEDFAPAPASLRSRRPLDRTA